MAAIEVAFLAEHVHGTTLSPRISGGASGEFGHDALGVHSASKHVAMVAICGDTLVALLGGGLKAGHHGFLTYVEVTESADLAHSVELTGLFLKPPDQQHFPVVSEQFLRRRPRLGGAFSNSHSLNLPEMLAGRAAWSDDYSETQVSSTAFLEPRLAGRRLPKLSAAPAAPVRTTHSGTRRPLRISRGNQWVRPN